MGPANIQREIDWAFLRRSFWFSVGAVIWIGVVAVFCFGLNWSRHYVAIGLWMDLYIATSSKLLLAIVAIPRNKWQIWFLGAAKIALIGCLLAYCIALDPQPEAIASGVLTLPCAFMVYFLGWMSRRRRRDESADKAGIGAKN